MAVPGTPRSSWVEKLPSVHTARGAIRSSWRNRYSWQLSISCGSGSRLPGGRHFRTFATNTSARVMPISPSSVSSSRPAWPTNGRPCLSSFAPGASPTNIRSASALPEPKTTVWRAAASCGHLVHACACRQTALSSSRRSAAVPIASDSSRADGGLDLKLNLEAGISVRELDLISIVGAGRLGTALTAALIAAGYAVRGPLGRDADPGDATVVLLCVPDGEIAAAAAAVPAGRVGLLFGHCSGATGLGVLAPHEAFSLHPLMTVPTGAPPTVFAGAGCAIDGTK